jgi:hypothetical protein
MPRDGMKDYLSQRSIYPTLNLRIPPRHLWTILMRHKIFNMIPKAFQFQLTHSISPMHLLLELFSKFNRIMMQ